MNQQNRGPWYWLSALNLGFLSGALSGRLGREAQDEARTALSDMIPLRPVLAAIAVVGLAIIVGYGLYLLA